MRKVNLLLGVAALEVLLSLSPPVANEFPETLTLLGVFPAFLQAGLLPTGREPAPAPASAEGVAHPRLESAPSAIVALPGMAAARVEAGPTLPPAPGGLLREGRYIALELKGPQVLELGQRMAFVATLTNPERTPWNLVAEVVVRKGNGSQETLIRHRRLRLQRGKSLRVPLALRAQAWRFPPGLTEFVAFLRDPQGQVVDQASITFLLTVPLR